MQYIHVYVTFDPFTNTATHSVGAEMGPAYLPNQQRQALFPGTHIHHVHILTHITWTHYIAMPAQDGSVLVLKSVDEQHPAEV